jgi:ABC-type spermidine/putrescine transport system permease subunit II
MSYVIAGYVISLVTLAGYAASLVVRRRRLRGRGSVERR